MRKPRILITNDDGIHAPGIRYLCNAVKHFATVTIAAPASEQSGVGMAMTFRDPLRIEEMPWRDVSAAWSVSGTPTDCVKMALSTLMNEPPDLIISGINRGSNAGRNLLYSGTVAGVIEGINHDVPGIAFSCVEYRDPNYAEAEQYIAAITQHMLMHPLPKGTLLNVNFPSHKKGKMLGVKLTRQGQEFWAEKPEKRNHPDNEFHYYWLGARIAQFDEIEDCDISWLSKGYAAAVPVHVGELTDHHHLRNHKDHFEKAFEW